MKTLILIWFSLSSIPSFAWQDELKKEIKEIDQNFEGDIGVVIKNLKDGSRLEYNVNKSWYLSSTIKVLVAICLMEEIQEGKIHLDQKITLKEKDFVDGSGPLLWNKPGEQFTIAYLLRAMLQESDSTATDILIGLIGAEELNQDIQKLLPDAGKVTSLLEVRYLAYSKLHPKARTLSNMDFILLKNVPVDQRHIAFSEKIKVTVNSLKSSDLEEAHEKYYEQGYNSAPLQSYIDMLEKLEKGELLSSENTKLLLTHMEKMNTGENRVKAGLTEDFIFRQKTGTQIHRACNVGLIRKAMEEKSSIALAICIKKPSENINSDGVFKKIGQKIVESSVL